MKFIIITADTRAQIDVVNADVVYQVRPRAVDAPQSPYLGKFAVPYRVVEGDYTADWSWLLDAGEVFEGEPDALFFMQDYLAAEDGKPVLNETGTKIATEE